MGNYHEYEITDDQLVADMPKVYFNERNRVENLMTHGWTQSKSWEFEEDMKIYSKHNKGILVTVFEKDEDETILRKHQFLNGVHKYSDGTIVYPDIKWD